MKYATDRRVIRAVRIMNRNRYIPAANAKTQYMRAILITALTDMRYARNA